MRQGSFRCTICGYPIYAKQKRKLDMDGKRKAHFPMSGCEEARREYVKRLEVQDEKYTKKLQGIRNRLDKAKRDNRFI